MGLITGQFAENIEAVDDVHFVDFMRRGVEPENRIYELAADFQKLTKIISDIMLEDSKLNLVLFKDACQVH